MLSGWGSGTRWDVSPVPLVALSLCVAQCFFFIDAAARPRDDLILQFERCKGQ